MGAMLALLLALSSLASTGALTLSGDPSEGHFSVVAVIDTGINLGNAGYDAPALNVHPSTYITDYPTDAEILNRDYTTSQGTDAELGKLYWVPGTRVVAAISFGEYNSLPALSCPDRPGKRPIRDDCSFGGHGQVTSRRAAGEDPNILIVAVEVPSPDVGIQWAIQQPWIDVISLSWGTLANAPVGAAYLLTKTATEQGKVVVVAAGNGVTNTGIVGDRSLTFTSPYSGPSWVVSVGAVKECNYRDYSWHSVPVDVVAPSPDGGGTSFATPIVAGTVGRVIAHARAAVGDTGEGPRAGNLVVAADGVSLPALGPLNDGLLSRPEAEDAVQKTAFFNFNFSSWCNPGPIPILKGAALDELPPLGPADFVHEGYGIVNSWTGGQAVDVVLGLQPAPDRIVEASYVSTSDEIRDRIWDRPNVGGVDDPIWDVVCEVENPHFYCCDAFVSSQQLGGGDRRLCFR